MAQANVQAAAEEAGVRVCLSWVSPQPQSTQQHGAGAMARVPFTPINRARGTSPIRGPGQKTFKV